MSYVQINNIEKSFQGRQVLKNMNLVIEKGEFVTLLGPSGCGKTTLLRIVAGLETSDAGAVILNGQEIVEGDRKRDQNIGMVFQSYALFPNMTAYENIAFGLKIKKVPENTIRKQVKEIMETLHITGKENNYPHQMSGGQQQRVALARALVTKPALLLLDEPLSAVDAKVRESARILIRDVQRQMGITTIFVTHDQSEALVMSDRIVIMNAGDIMQVGTPEVIYHQPENKFVANFIGTFNFLPGELIGLKADQEVCVRPEKIQLCEKSDLTQFEAGKYIALLGQIRNSYILGNTIRTEVEVQGTIVLVDRLNGIHLNSFARQEEVGLVIEEKAINILKT